MPNDRTPERRLTTVGALAILAAALGIRWWCSRGDLWLDEIWTVRLSATISSALQILTSIHEENNHYLNTWIVWLMGPDAAGTWYRWPAVAAGVGTVAVAGLIGRNRIESRIAMVLTACSHLLVHYSSEARGYAYVLFFSALAFWLLDASFGRRGHAREWLFAIVCVLGFLAHPMFIYFYGAAAGWAGWRWHAAHRRSSDTLARAARAFLLPGLAALGLWEIDLSHTLNAGGPIYNALDVILETASRTVGGPGIDPLAALTGLCVIPILMAGIARLRRSGDERWLFYLLVCVVAPLVLLIGLQRSVLYVRYFLIVALFALLAFSAMLSALWTSGTARRGAAIAMLAAALAGNAWHIQRLAVVSRGQYSAALELMNTLTHGPEITVSSDHDFRNFTMIAYYENRVPNLKPIRYIAAGQWPPEGPEWMLVHDFSETYHPRTEMRGPNGAKYRLVHSYPYAGLSGWTWAVYQRAS